MSIGIGSVLGLWLVSGVAFWSGFVLLGLGFQPSGSREDGEVASGTERVATVPTCTLEPRPRGGPVGSRVTPDHVLTRSGR